MRFPLFSAAFVCHQLRLLVASPATVIFLGFAWTMAAGLLFFVGGFFASNDASLNLYLAYLPWVYCLMFPALAMGLWAEDARNGTAERLLTLPFSMPQLVLGRHVVLLLVLVVFLLGSWPLWATLAWLGNPDWGQLAAALLGQVLLGQVLLALALLASVLARSYVVAFVLGVALLALALFAGVESVADAMAPWAPAWLVQVLYETSLLEHARRFTQGTVDVRSLGYMLGVVALLLAVQVALLQRRYRRGAAWPWLLAGVVALLVLTGMGRMVPWRLDMTADRLYTLSAASRQMVEGLAKPVTFTFYDSRSNPDLPPASRVMARRVRDMLADVQRLNPSMVRVDIINPDLRAADELAAAKAGLAEQPLAGGQGFYMGLAATMDGRRSVLPALEPSRTPYLEFDLMSLLAEVRKLERKTVALLAVPNLRLQDMRPRWVSEMSGFYTLDYLLPGVSEIPPATDVLVVMMAPYLPLETLYALDQYLVRGGKVLMLLDPYQRSAPDAMTSLPDRNAADAELNHPADLLRLWGIGYDGNSIVADEAHAAPVNDPKLGFRTYPLWLALGHGNVNPDLPFTSYIDTLAFAESGALTLGELAPRLAYTPVVASGGLARVVPRRVLDGGTPQLVASGLQGEPQAYVLGGLLEGHFPSTFKDIPPAVAELARREERLLPAHVGEPASKGALLVYADTDFAAEDFAVQKTPSGELVPVNDNLVLLFNSLQYLSGEGELLALRGKGVQPRSFGRVEEMLTRLGAQYTRVENKMAAELYQIAQRLEQLKAQAKPEDISVANAAANELRSYEERNLELKKQLRDVRKSLRRDVVGLERMLAVINMLAMPLLALAGWWWWRRRKRLA